MGQFADKVQSFQRTYETRLRIIAREAVQETVSIAQTPGPTIGPPAHNGNGGRMPVVTGFLRASIQAAVGQMPSGPTENTGKTTYAGDAQAAGEPVAVTLLKWKPESGEPLYVGWTAVYARRMEYRYGFMRGATELWDETVRKAAEHVR